MRTCNTCKHWATEPLTDVKHITTERICLKSAKHDSSMYGMDGRAIITWPDFGCNQYEDKDKD